MLVMDYFQTQFTLKWRAFRSSPILWGLDFQMKRKIYSHLERELWATEQQSNSLSSQPR